MKIAICVTRYAVGGVGTSTFILASALRRMGHAADILVTSNDVGNDFDRARRDGWPVEAICANVRWLKKRLILCYDRLKDYDAVLDNHSLETRMLAATLPAHIVKISIVRARLRGIILEAVYYSKGFHRLVGVSPEVVGLLEREHPACGVSLVPNAVVVHGEGRASLSTPLRIGYLGRYIDPQKNVEILPAIARALQGRNLRFELILRGEGALPPKTRQEFVECGLESAVRGIALVPREKVSDFYRSLSFGLFPSRDEGFGLTLAEAMGAGCVPVASDIPSYRWILGESASRLAVPTFDPEAYAEVIGKLSADPVRYGELQEALSRRQQSCFTPEATAAGYLNFIEQFRPDPSGKPRAVHRSSSGPEWSKIHCKPMTRIRCTRTWQCLQLMKSFVLHRA